MPEKTKKKLCWNCEGSVAIIDEKCPYCGVSVDLSPIIGTQPHDHLAPPFRMNNSQSDSKIDSSPEKEESEPDVTIAPLVETSTSEVQQVIYSLFSLLIGVVFVLFGLILLLFSDQYGIFTLQWHTSYWFLYVFLGLPLIFYGWRAASQLSD